MTTHVPPTQKGFTLIETIVAIGIASLLIGVLFLLFDNYNKVFKAQQTSARVLVSASQAGNELQNYARQASAVVSSYTFSGTTYTSNSTTLVMKMPAVDSSGSLITGEYDYVVFYTSSGKLYEKVSAYASSDRKTLTKQLSDTASSVTFTYNNGTPSSATQVDVDIIMSATEAHATASHELKQTLYLQNI